MKLPNQPKKGDSLIGWGVAVIRYLRSSRVRGISGGRIEEGPNGILIVVDPVPPRGRTAAGSTCPFGELVSMPEGSDYPRGIRGGVIYCGDQNFNVNPQGINEAVEGVFLVYIELTCEANRDDDGEIILPGILTSTDTPSWEQITWTEETDYPSNTNPAVSDGLGTIIIPIGKLTIAGGSASLEPVDCGNITVGQCAGVLSHSRG